jgi:uncharacterized protein YbaP (TraB family)
MDFTWILRRHSCKGIRVFVCFVIALLATGVPWSKGSDAPERGKHFLWSLKTEENTVFFLGSLHVFKSADYPLAAEIEKAYAEAQEVVFETDIDLAKDPDLHAKMMGLALYPDGQTLADNVSKKTYKMLEQKILATGLPIETFERFKPWFVALTLSVLELQRLGFDPNYGIDTHFHNKAKADGKRIIALESPEYQLELFKTLDRKEQESFLSQTLEEIDVIGTMASDMTEAWRTGDASKLDSIIKRSFKDHLRMYDRFVVQRNKNWVQVIDKLTRHDKNVLVIVGAAHLVGKDSVLALLRAKGYGIEQR